MNLHLLFVVNFLLFLYPFRFPFHFLGKTVRSRLSVLCWEVEFLMLSSGVRPNTWQKSKHFINIC